MKNNPLISVIVPVYNVEKHIAKCLKSIQKQTLEDFECIVVDDGSPDDSIEIGKAAVKGDERFVFVGKENGGLASARNLGLDQAKGKYIAFVDSDDWVEPEFLELPSVVSQRYSNKFSWLEFSMSFAPIALSVSN